MTKQLVSVIMLARNAQETLTIALDSILRQSYRDIEVIVCDLASNDQSLSVATSNTDSRVTVLPLAADDETAAFSQGLLLAKSNLVVRFPANGVAHTNMIAEQLRVFRSQPNTAITLAQYVLMDNDGVIIQRPDIPLHVETLLLDTFLGDNVVQAPYMLNLSSFPRPVQAGRLQLSHHLLWSAACQNRLAATTEYMAAIRSDSRRPEPEDAVLWNVRYKILPTLARTGNRALNALDNDSKNRYIKTVIDIHKRALRKRKYIFAWLTIAAALTRSGGRRAILHALKQKG